MLTATHVLPPATPAIVIEAKALVVGTKLTQIRYSDRPLPQGAPVIALTIEQAEKKLGFTYTESLVGNREELKSVLENRILIEQIRNRPDLPRESAIRERLSNPLDSFVVCNMGTEVGHGLFADKDIAPGTILFLYAGLIGEAKTAEAGDHYAYLWGAAALSDATQTISAQHMGGLSRFCQHLPQDKERHKTFLKDTLRKQFGSLIEAKGIDLDQFVADTMKSASTDKELDNIDFASAEIRNRLQTGNIKVSQTVFNGIPTVVCWTEYGIHCREQVGFSYGHQYEEGAKQRYRYFMEDGSLIPLSAYRYKSEPNSVLSPIQLYNQAAADYKSGDYPSAIAKATLVIAHFQDKKVDIAVKRGQCYSLLASSYREQKQFEPALTACEQALILFKVNSPDKLPATLTKYNNCLENTEPQKIYSGAVALYKDSHYWLAQYKLLFVLPLLKVPAEQATCHSTLASCYSKLGNIQEAIKHSEIALHLRQSCLPSGHKLIGDTMNKLAELRLSLPAEAASDGSSRGVAVSLATLASTMGALSSHSAAASSSSSSVPVVSRSPAKQASVSP